MNTSAAIKAMLASCGMKQGELKTPLGVGSAQAVSNKVRLNRWTASELASVAEYCGCKLALILADGERVLISADDPAQAAGTETAGTAAAPGVPVGE